MPTLLFIYPQTTWILISTYLFKTTFQTFTAASPPTLTTLSSPTHPTPNIPSLCAFAAFHRAPGFSRLQTCKLVSNPPLTTCLPSAFHANATTRAVCAVHRSVATLQSEVEKTRIFPPALPAARWVPDGEKERDEMGVVEFVRVVVKDKELPERV